MIWAKGDGENIPMDQERMQELVMRYCGNGQAQENIVQAEFQDATLLVISDEGHDRMRIISPITDASELTDELKSRLLESNFHSALDARYAIGNDILYSAFIHPLSKLDQVQIESAVRQVATLRISFGTDFTSGELEFSG